MGHFHARTFFHCDKNIESYVKNLTSSYANKSNESSVVATSVVMFVLAAIFFNLNLFSRASNISAILNPTVRLFISTVLSLFLPIMSYLFSEAKNAYMVDSGPNFRGSSLDLPLRARVILTWMLLVELLRKKVEAILVNAGMQRYSTIINHIGSVAWLGNLVFFNLKRAGQKTVYGTLWLVCAAKLVQRVAIAELAKRSLAYGKNARLMSSYATQMSRHYVLADGTGAQVLRSCEYVVMGEEKLVLKPGPRGYKLLDHDKLSTEQTVVTVGKIWQLDELKGDIRLKRLCLSFALFKLLRRRFEHLPAMTREETIYCRAVLFEGLCRKEGGLRDPEVALFQVINDEVYFLSEYYNSVLPVVLASPYFFLVNYLVVPVVIAVLCVMTVNLCGNGSMAFAFRSINVDNDAISIGIITLTKCLLKNVLKTPAAFFSTVDLTITYLLFLAFIYEEVWEFLVFVHSKWFMVSLLCTYTAQTQRSNLLWALRRITWVHDKLGDPSRITIKQYSVMRFCWLSITLPATSLPRRAKRLIMKRILAYGHDSSAAPLSTGKAALDERYPHLSWFCESDSVAEVILTWHIATSLLETKNGARPGEDRSKVVATTLSQYCAYLVAFHPELLPDDPEGTESAYMDMKKDLKEKMGCWTYYSSWKSIWCEKMMVIAGKLEQEPGYQLNAQTVVQKGMVLGKKLIVEAEKESQVSVWDVLADVWVELIVYIAPSGCDEHVKGHEESLVQGGELITMLWALSTHTDITRPQPTVDEGTQTGV